MMYHRYAGIKKGCHGTAIASLERIAPQYLPAYSSFFFGASTCEGSVSGACGDVPVIPS